MKSTHKTLIYMTKQKSFLKKSKKKIITTHLDARCHARSFFIFAKLAIQNPNIQPGAFWLKWKASNPCLFLLTVILWTFRLFPWFVVNHCVLKCFIVYYQWGSRTLSYFKVLDKNSWKHPCSLKLGWWKVATKAFISNSDVDPKR